ncbi:cytochrome b5 [Lactarius hatsudake]|nr:cytochrome b5 [Lactarius hatsudake]
MSFSLSHPINTALLIYTLYLLQRTVFPSTSVPRTPPTEFKSGYSWLPRAHAPTVLFTTYTPRTLTKFDGKDGGRILLAIAWHQGMYGNFAGRDASRGMAKQSFRSRENMKGWIEHFSNKYIICGRLVENDAAL